ncbi:hypothetical protein EDD16DRAFT_1732862, partial [Pisolithus croceorrhizus]
MARTQSRKRRLFRFAMASNSASGLASSSGRSETRAGDFSPIPETSGLAPPGRLARMKRFFHRSNQGPSTATATEIIDTQDSGGVRVAPDQGAAEETTGGGAQEQQEQPQAAPTKNLEKLAANPNLEPKPKLQPEPEPEPKLDPKPKLKPEPEPTPATAGHDINAAAKELSGVTSISNATQGVVGAVGIVNTTASGIQTLSDTYLKPFKVFNQVVSTLANVHPYTQVALGVLTSVSQLFLNQASLDKAVSDLLDTIRNVYEWLVHEDRISVLDKVALAKIAEAVSDSAHFVVNYSTTKNFWIRAGKNSFSETRGVVDDQAQTLESLMQQCRDRTVRDIQVNTCRILEELNFDGMAYAGGAGINTAKTCLEGTRTEILRDIMNWIN